MAPRRTWKEAALAWTLVLAWIPLGCSEAPPPASPPASPSPAAAPAAPVKASKGKKSRNPDDEMGIAEKRAQRRNAADGAKAP